MPKVVGPQNVPSSILEIYKEIATLLTPDNVIRKRYPFEMLEYRSTGLFVSAKQLSQRTRFLAAVALYNNLTQGQREEWFDSPPNTVDFTWYMNYFIMSSLTGNLDLFSGGCGVVKKVYLYSATIPVGSTYVVVPIAEVDVSKTMSFVQGSSILSFSRSGQDFIYIDFPTVWVLAADEMLVKWLMGTLSGGSTQSAVVSIFLVEYI